MVPGTNMNTDGKCVCGNIVDATCFWIDCKSYHGCVIAGVLVYYFDFDVCDA